MPADSKETTVGNPTASLRFPGSWTARLGALLCAILAHLPPGCAPSPHHSQPSADLHSDLPDAGSVTIRMPAGAPTIPTGTVDEKGTPVTVACANCHAVRPPNGAAKLGEPLVTFHQGLVGRHGSLSCSSCHHPADGYATLRLADGKSVPYPEVMSLCAQCHGPQFRDYQHGAHGGMTGFWDLKLGGRVRNNCVDCHDPHAPRYPTVAPARGPIDRLPSNRGGHE